MIQTVWKILRDPNDADDALQCALTTLWRKWSTLRTHINPEALVLRICVDAAYDQLRKTSRRRRRDQPATQMLVAADPSQEAEQEETEQEILQAIAALRGKQRTATYLRLIEGYSYEAIAATVRCGEPTARKHVARGRQRLQASLSHLAPNHRQPSKS
jgi:RNA polymerase sigma factor (sigma-70 family)